MPGSNEQLRKQDADACAASNRLQKPDTHGPRFYMDPDLCDLIRQVADVDRSWQAPPAGIRPATETNNGDSIAASERRQGDRRCLVNLSMKEPQCQRDDHLYQREVRLSVARARQCWKQARPCGRRATTKIIRAWASEVSAEPATGEATPSGPASVLKVADGGTGLRFNFPGVSPFRAISWDEWLDHFTSHDLTFVYDDAEPGRPTSARYRIVPASELSSH